MGQGAGELGEGPGYCLQCHQGWLQEAQPQRHIGGCARRGTLGRTAAAAWGLTGLTWDKAPGSRALQYFQHMGQSLDFGLFRFLRKQHQNMVTVHL